MPYATGLATNFNDLLGAIENAATLAGWTSHGNGLLSTNGCAVQLTVIDQDVSSVLPPYHPSLSMYGGSGVSGGALVDQSPPRVRMWSLLQNNVWREIVFPVLYDIMAFPEEVYCFINHNVTEFQYLAFGTGNVPGLPGSGAWISGTYSGSTPNPNGLSGGSTTSFRLTPDSGGSVGGGSSASGAIFADGNNTGGGLQPHGGSSFVHHGFTDHCVSAWALGANGTYGGDMLGQRPLYPLLSTQPSKWNEGAALLPLRAWILRAEGFMSLVADLRHARNVRIDYLEPKAVYSLGADRWKVFPWIKKDLSARDGGGGILHSGTIGVAIRYDGP